MTSHRVSVMVVLAGLGAAACGPTSAEMAAAKTTIYHASTASIFQIAAQVTEEMYKLGDVDAAGLRLATQPRFYSPEGDIQSEGAGGFVKLDNHSVKVSLVVEVVEVGDDTAVTVTPVTLQYLAGSPQMRRLAPDDPTLPPFVKGRADALAFAIYERAKRYARAPSAGPP